MPNGNKSSKPVRKHFDNMHTITQLGEAVLTRLFTSRFGDSEVDIGIMVDALDLSQVNRSTCTRYVFAENEGREGKILLIWGMELGLRALEITEPGESIENGLKKCIKDNGMRLPSHIIILSWKTFAPPKTHESHSMRFREFKTYTSTIFRLFPWQEAELQIWRNATSLAVVP